MNPKVRLRNQGESCYAIRNANPGLRERSKVWDFL